MAVSAYKPHVLNRKLRDKYGIDLTVCICFGIIATGKTEHSQPLSSISTEY